MEVNRREFIQQAGILSTIAAVGTAFPAMNAFGDEKQLSNVFEHKLMKLPYAYDALEPYIDAETVELHYSKHHQGYVAGMNKAEAMIQEMISKQDYALVDYWTQKLAFHGAGNYLHQIYWNSMAPNAGGEPKGRLKDQINMDFGSFDKMKMLFGSASKSVEGNGWGMLAFRPEDKKLIVLQVENHQKFTTWNIIPILAIDVWEHSYYLKYKNKRADYVDGWWNIVNWENAGMLFSMHKGSE